MFGGVKHVRQKDDYGYFGKDIDGYVHYKQAFDENFKENKQSNMQNISYNLKQSKSDSVNPLSKVLKKHKKKCARQAKHTKEITTFGVIVYLALTWCAMIFAIIGIPTLILTIFVGSNAADSGIGILILVAGVIFLVFH